MNGPEGLAIVNSDCEYLLITILSSDSEDRYISRLLCDYRGFFLVSKKIHLQLSRGSGEPCLR